MQKPQSTVILLDVTVLTDSSPVGLKKKVVIYMAQKRKPLTHKGSSRLFTKTASFVHPKNAPAVVMRGGVRL